MTLGSVWGPGPWLETDHRHSLEQVALQRKNCEWLKKSCLSSIIMQQVYAAWPSSTTSKISQITRSRHFNGHQVGNESFRSEKKNKRIIGAFVTVNSESPGSKTCLWCSLHTGFGQYETWLKDGCRKYEEDQFRDEVVSSSSGKRRSTTGWGEGGDVAGSTVLCVVDGRQLRQVAHGGGFAYGPWHQQQPLRQQYAVDRKMTNKSFVDSVCSFLMASWTCVEDLSGGSAADVGRLDTSLRHSSGWVGDCRWG